MRGYSVVYQTEKSEEFEMLVTLAAILVLLLSFELWVPLAVIFGAIKLMTTLSLSAAWEAAKSVPIWIWDFVQSSLS